MELKDYELRHFKELNEISSECSLFLNRNNDSFPLSGACKIALFGNGARNTIKGGTGSGDVNSRCFDTIEEALVKEGFEILSTDWLNSYDEFRKTTRRKFLNDVRKRAHEEHMLSVVYSMGCAEEEKNYSSNLDYDTDTAIYVLSRQSGEGNDRRAIKGDVLLSDTEIKDIIYLDNKYKNFILVLNVGGVIDLSPIKDISNILYLSELGVVTGKTLVDIILGRANPSGKLTTTWAKYSDYQTIGEFGNRNDNRYIEGIYVGYKYFDSFNVEPLYPFGYGKSYSDFELKTELIKKEKSKITINVTVKNISSFKGKEVVEVYVSQPKGKLDKPYQVLVGYAKTKEIGPSRMDYVEVSFDMDLLSSYFVDSASYILEKGEYIVRVGNSSRNTTPVYKIKVNEDIVTHKLKNICDGVDFKDLESNLSYDSYDSLETIEVNKDDFSNDIVNYNYKYDVNPLVRTLSDRDLSRICCGQFSGGITAIVGESSAHVPGAAGETCLSVNSLKKYLVMADGPAGVRVLPEYGKDDKGIYNVAMDQMMKSFLEYLPRFVYKIMDPSKNLKNRHGEIITQYTTAIPIGTALAQSFNKDVFSVCGNIVGEEMEMFNVDMWLAPALNIHRNILCGRNFEYYSEDPLVSGLCASYISKAVESHDKKYVTIKHFACNNQEYNRNNNNSILSERALREIYLKGFEIAIKEANPKSIMTSYNLINGVHSSESHEICTDVLRCEWNYKGLVMTDWIESGRTFNPRSIHKAPYASNNIKAGNDLTMPGSLKDVIDIRLNLLFGKLKREELELSASRIFDFIEEYK